MALHPEAQKLADYILSNIDDDKTNRLSLGLDPDGYSWYRAVEEAIAQYAELDLGSSNNCRYAVDIPGWDFNSGCPDTWINIDYFDSFDEALSFVRENFGADTQGNVCLLSCLDEEIGFEEEDDDGED